MGQKRKSNQLEKFKNNKSFDRTYNKPKRKIVLEDMIDKKLTEWDYDVFDPRDYFKKLSKDKMLERIMIKKNERLLFINELERNRDQEDRLEDYRDIGIIYRAMLKDYLRKYNIY